MLIPPASQWGFFQWIMAIIIGAACIAVMYVALGFFGVAIPAFMVTIFWIVLAAFVAILAIKLLWSLFSGPPNP